ncbi:HalOD1 output domain-containing protein [Halorussus sp. MSC15.2]|uniref:HalOD1 output domain-containing protein n=1 Tax=Halorussus sp. MSC15.2 TaxID=2283638 RepID=UPI0013D1CFFA|nr:HalOD1 output domain-containing protein [Halorussus sp. MSC15.2]NEU55879.1 hypothetical protein [Halorussus sp. MSC15.2]
MSENQSAARRGTVLSYEVNEDERTSEGVVAAVAAAADADPVQMDPLAATIDPDALDALFASHHDGTPRNAGRAQFSFFGYEVVVSGEGCVTVLDPTS